MATDLKAETHRVRECAQRRDPQSVSIVESALASKWEGLQSAALQVLGEWGDDWSRVVPCSIIEGLDDRPFGWSIRGVAIRSLAECITSDEASWALDRFFALEGALAKHESLPAAAALPEGPLRERAVAESSSPDRNNRQAAMKLIGRSELSDKREMLTAFESDDDVEIRKAARLLIQYVDSLPS